MKPIYNSTKLFLFPDDSAVEDILEKKSMDEVLGSCNVLKNEECFEKIENLEDIVYYLCFNI